MNPLPSLPAWATDLSRSVLMGVAGLLAARGYVTQTQVPELVAGGLVVMSVAWTWIEKHPAKNSVLEDIKNLIIASGQANSARFNTSVDEVGAAVLAYIQPKLDATIKARMGVLSGPVESLARDFGKQLESTIVADVKVPHLSV